MLNIVHTWSPPAGIAMNPTFTVQIKPANETEWTDLFVYNVSLGHQDGTKFDSSMVIFDFSGTIDVKVAYHGGRVNCYDIRPNSYGIDAAQVGNTLTFSTTQNEDSPRKIVIRINDSWNTEDLHILTNPLETDVPSECAPNVHLIHPGDAIPLQLPEGKDTYYFKPGQHTLPQGSWLEVDLGAEYMIDRFDLRQTILQMQGLGMEPLSYPNKFVVETKVQADEPYTAAYDGTNNTDTGYLTRTFAPKKARYVRLMLLGSNVASGWVFSNSIGEFKVYEAGGTVNLALNRAIAGAMPSYIHAVDGNEHTGYETSSNYGNWHSGESFFISQNDTTVYLAPGAVCYGSISSDEVDRVTIRGRGILDGSQLQHTNPNPGEGRTGAIWLSSGCDNLVEGITLIDPTMWAVVMNFSTRPVVKNIHIIAYEVNADGIHFSGSSHGLITGVFIRTPDDDIVMYHYGKTSLNTVQNSVLWGDDAHTILIGLGSVADAHISDLTFQNIDVLNQQGVYILDKFTGVLKLWANGGNHIRNIVFKDIRIDAFRDPYKAAVFQFRTDERFPGDRDGGIIQNITLDNVTYQGAGEQKALLKGVNQVSCVKDVYITNYKRQGKLVVDVISGHIDVQDHVSNVYFGTDDDDLRGSIR
ncbi:glycosyl hydrolase family 28 protein [Paenibacillus sp. HWE-109]|uniref:glycosyl hydrolase family 28 protein n=1 Tax=Paenibacillus sp. HWE-109 TaxID=1306526 RepID=UPI001EDFB609|nr:glycosyl hydrolase family 28 protein [Paenibacillus sp. HWE-109]UKS27006.1 glycosyl hydrolase family 28 protein [Paenibacillus sp. HWE-109]